MPEGGASLPGSREICKRGMRGFTRRRRVSVRVLALWLRIVPTLDIVGAMVLVKMDRPVGPVEIVAFTGSQAESDQDRK